MSTHFCKVGTVRPNVEKTFSSTQLKQDFLNFKDEVSTVKKLILNINPRFNAVF